MNHIDLLMLGCRDFCATFGVNFAQFLQPQLTDPLLMLGEYNRAHFYASLTRRVGLESEERATKQLVKWCRKEIKKIK